MKKIAFYLEKRSKGKNTKTLYGMKILIIQHKNFLNGNGGTEKITCFLANHFSSIGRNVEVATNENTSGNVLFPLNKEVKISNIFTDSLNQIYIFPLYNYK